MEGMGTHDSSEVVLLVPHLQYMVVLTPLVAGIACSLGGALLSLVLGQAPSMAATPSVALSLMYCTMYWLRDGSAEDQDGVCQHIGSLSILGGVMLVVGSEAALFSSMLWGVVSVLCRPGHDGYTT